MLTLFTRIALRQLAKGFGTWCADSSGSFLKVPYYGFAAMSSLQAVHSWRSFKMRAWKAQACSLQ